VLFRARTPRDIQQLKTDSQAVPATGREFSRTDRLFMRVAAYGLAVQRVAEATVTRGIYP